MWKYLGIIILLFTNINISYAEQLTKESVLLLDCKNIDFVDEDFYYPIDVNKFSSFKFGKNLDDIYQIDFSIRKGFKFPKKNQNGFTPIYDTVVKGQCFNDEIPKLMSYIYKEAKEKNNDISIYIHKDKDFFYLDINIK